MEIPGFASPSRDEFALSDRLTCLPEASVEGSPGLTTRHSSGRKGRHTCRPFGPTSRSAASGLSGDAQAGLSGCARPSGETASKVEAAAKAKIPGATIERVETDADTGSPYEAHVRKADGSELIVYVDASFDVTGTGTMGAPIGPGPATGSN